MAASGSPEEEESANISDDSSESGEKISESRSEPPEGRNTDGENYETTADIDLQLLEELGMSIQFYAVGSLIFSK